MLKKNILFLLFVFIFLFTYSQKDTESSKIYRSERTKVNDLVHTILKVNFDFSKRYLYGETWIKAKAHFYPTQKLTLDAKAMLIHEVKMGNKPLAYNYENDELIIELGNAFAKDEIYEIYIKYTARPELVKQKGSQAISDAKGLYFIDPDQTDPEKPTQIWTQGETESNSCWFPTIDSPNQKSTQEIYITVPQQFTTLSNGLLINKINNNDGTRTDYWKMSKPHAPYLFFMGIGEYAVVHDSWNGIPVDYYVEKEYEPVAKDIFGNTPEMMQFFSQKFGVPYPWEKYSQIVGRDYVSGAMENTTTTLHAESAYQNKGQLIDENTWEDVIAHELSHHWFGDLVTTESWSNLTVNESFATYAEYLWIEYKYGKDVADRHLWFDKQNYFSGENEQKPLVRFHYANREDMFDGVSYQKGATILHMLRKELGDAAFFAGLQKYLTDYQFGTAEAHQLRIALEQVSGKDLNPFFNQWYYANGHPKLNITYEYDLTKKTVTVNVQQKDKVFEVPLKIDIYESGKKIEHQVQLFNKEHHFTYEFQKKPDLVLVNADHTLLCQITDEQKDINQYIFQLNNAPHFEDKQEAIQYLSAKQDNEQAFKAIMKSLQDSYHEIRILALQNIDLAQQGRKEAIKIIENLAQNDPKTKVQAEALKVLGKLLNPQYIPLFERSIQKTSNAMVSNAIIAMYDVDKSLALRNLYNLNEETKQNLAPLLIQIYIKEKDESQMPFIAKNLMDFAFSDDEKNQNFFKQTYQWIAASNNIDATRNLITDFVSKGIRYKQYGVDQFSNLLLNNMLEIQKQSNNSNKDIIIKEIKTGLSKLLQ